MLQKVLIAKIVGLVMDRIMKQYRIDELIERVDKMESNVKKLKKFLN
tara:strand:- start:679 stop:819 length:141 start_codon:yes stop_codon:yes gene_type:complete